MDSNQTFQESAQFFAKAYVSRLDESLEYFLKYSREYLLDELALFSCMSKNGNKVFVYPGGMDIFHEMSQKIHPDVNEYLKSLISIELKLSSNSQNNKGTIIAHPKQALKLHEEPITA